MGHRDERGVLPAFKKKRLVFEDKSLENENQELRQHYEGIIAIAKDKQVSYSIAFEVGESIALDDSSDWKIYASALGVNDVKVLKRISYWAKNLQEYPLTKLLHEDFTNNGTRKKVNLGDLLQVLLAESQYRILTDIRALVEECITKPQEDASYENVSEIMDRTNYRIESPTVSFTSEATTDPKTTESCHLDSHTSSTFNARDHNNIGLQTYSTPSILSSSLFSTERSIREIFLSLTVSSSTSSTQSHSVSPQRVPTAKPFPAPLLVCSTEPTIFIFITHTLADRGIAETVARRLIGDFNYVAVTQFQLLHYFQVSHGTTVSKLLREVHFVMPIVSQSYLREIEVPVLLEECPNRQLSVRNIFTALESDFFRRGSLNWKSRPVIAEGVNADLAREKQELFCAMRLWDDWADIGPMLRNTVLMCQPQFG